MLHDILERAKKYATEGKVNLTKKELEKAKKLASTSNIESKKIKEIEQLAYFFGIEMALADAEFYAREKNFSLLSNEIEKARKYAKKLGINIEERIKKLI